MRKMITGFVAAVVVLASANAFVAQAEGPTVDGSGNKTFQGVWTGGLDGPNANIDVVDERGSAPGKAAESFPVELIECSITDGCDVPIAFVDDDGEIVKVLVIRLADPDEDDATE